MFFVFCLGLVVGLFVAWSFWPQPDWAKKLMDKLKNSLK